MIYYKLKFIIMSGQICLLEEHRHEYKPSRRSTLLQNYDPTAYPPDLQFAEKHGLSQRLGKNISPLDNVQRCRCCLEPIHKQQLPLLCDLSQLQHCGESTPLYFRFLKQIILLLMVNCAILTLPLTIINFIMGNQCKIVNNDVFNIFNSVCRGSAINIMNVSIIDAMQIQALIIFIAVIINIVFIAYLQVQMQGYIQAIKKGKLQASDFSFIIKGLPSDITIAEIQKYVEDKMMFQGAPDVAIVKIYLIYNLKEYLNLLLKKQELISKKIDLEFTHEKLEEQNLKSTNYQRKLLLQQKKTNISNELKATELQLQRTQSKISNFESITNEITFKLKNEGILENQDINKDILNFSGKCIVTVNNRRSKDVIVEVNRTKSCFHHVAYRLSELLEGKKSKIIISPAPDPSDILFGNMGSKKKTVWKKRIMYSSIIFLLIFVDFLIVALTRKFLKQEKAIQQGNIIFSFLNSIIVSLFCSAFRRIVNISESQSYYTTISKMSYNKVAKMVFIFQLNMLFTTFVANVASFYLIRQDKPTFQMFPLNFETFLFDVFFLIATNPIITLIMTYFDHRHIRGKYKKYQISKGSIAVCQAQANISYQNMNFDICYKYGTIYRFLLFSAGIAIIYPLAFFICLLAVTCLYWQDKYLLLRRYAITLKISSRFTILSQKIMNQFPVYLSLTNFLIMFIPIQDGSAFHEQKYSKAYYYLSVICLIISVLNYFTSNQWIKSIIKVAIGQKTKKQDEHQIYYKDIENNLLIDYSHDYPYFRVTKKIGLEKELDAVRREKLKELRDNEKLGVFEVLQSYINHRRYT